MNSKSHLLKNVDTFTDRLRQTSGRFYVVLQRISYKLSPRDVHELVDVLSSDLGRPRQGRMIRWLRCLRITANRDLLVQQLRIARSRAVSIAVHWIVELPVVIGDVLLVLSVLRFQFHPKLLLLVQRTLLHQALRCVGIEVENVKIAKLCGGSNLQINRLTVKFDLFDVGLGFSER